MHCNHARPVIQVQTFMHDIQSGADMTPIEVLWVEDPPGAQM